MHESNDRGLNRRLFLQRTATTAAVAGVASPFAPSAACWGSTMPYENTLRDRLWMWGHDSGSLRPGYDIGGPKDVGPGEAIEYMGIPNLCMVRFTGTPLPPFDDYVKQLAHAKRLTWSIVDGAKNFTNEQKKDQALELVPKTPNLIGFDLDDFFVGNAAPQTEGGEANAHLSVDQLRGIRKEMDAQKRNLDLSLVLYTSQLNPAIKSHIDEVDSVYFWTWRASDLPKLEENFAIYRKIAPKKPTLLGIYMWNFGEKKTIPLELMKHQCRLALKWLRAGEVEGLIFHCTPLCGMDLEAVKWSRDWIARHADEVVRA
ncbi:hypothetical protein Pla52o_53560 [Novipirellula galeiformis]|uniref:Uncharacterized protein n=1 Tax=Novipirellula galeiformis TaxID=2528004 RepID=A0A5C6C0L7_9BACT|nr:hypothetical protein [Novipirellula galeiformis]TWU17181.1 hypothetical protein Pla52o_53560 [Novipirellula galeiformis]